MPLKNWFSTKKRSKRFAQKFDWDNNIAVAADESIYQALAKRGLLVRARFPKSLGRHLIREGQLGLSMKNGKPRFLAPGRFTLWSMFNKFRGRVDITKKVIQLGPVTILTVDQGEIAWTVKNGVNHIITEPGRYILRAPHVFKKCVSANSEYIELGTHRRISVPAGHVAIAYDKGRQIIITTEETLDGPYKTDSPTFRFDPETGFKSTQIEEIKLDTLPVNTREMIKLNVIGLIRYRVTNPEQAFFNVDNVHAAIKLQAEATLTSVFAQLSIDQISNSLSATTMSTQAEQTNANPANEVPTDLIHRATELFIEQFRQVVNGWGVELLNLNILSMDFTDRSYQDALRDRARRRMEADTNLVNLRATTDVVLGEADRERRKQVIEAEGRARSRVIEADAEVEASKKKAKAARILSLEPLAAQQAVMREQANIAKSFGDKTVLIPHAFELGAYNTPGTGLFVAQRQGRPGIANLATAAQATTTPAAVRPVRRMSVS